MIIRHCVEKTNIDENYMVIDPTLIKHVIVSGGKIHSMSGLIDPASHLNVDYSLHKVTKCIIAEKFEIGAQVEIEDNGLVFAIVGQSSYGHYGKVDYTERLTDMIDRVKEREKSKVSPTATVKTSNSNSNDVNTSSKV
ncbi:MAG TPA: hypothetical protein VE378_05295 [Nitrososphaeraceae archaeon]|jgi:hypothetical protein|nr:hypothetical protein [Nitrososphaeraceae archaeon]